MRIVGGSLLLAMLLSGRRPVPFQTTCSSSLVAGSPSFLFWQRSAAFDSGGKAAGLFLVTQMDDKHTPIHTHV